MTTEALSSNAPAPEALAPSDPAHAARNGLVINLLLVSAFVVNLNETIMNVAIPSIRDAFAVTPSAAQWLATAFLLTMAVVIPVTGFLLQRFTTRTIYMLAMSLFSTGTALAIFAPNLGLLVACRVIQASGTAVMMPLLMTTVMTLVAPQNRGSMMGKISVVMSLAPAAGPVVSGVILSYFHAWQYLFILVLPISLLALVLGWQRMVNVTTPHKASLDIVSVIVSAFAFGGLVYGLSGLGTVDAASDKTTTWIALAVGVVAMIVFVWRQFSLQRAGNPLLDLRTFKSYNFSVSNIMFVVGMAAMFGSLNILPYYLQNVLKLEPLYLGLVLLPGTLWMAFLGPFVGRLYDRIGPKPLIIPGMMLISAVLWGMTLVGTTTWLPLVIGGYLVMCTGFALLFGPLFTLSLAAVKPELYSHASALLGSIQQVAGAAGVALLIAVMASVAQSQGGLDNIDALAGGIRMAFLVGAIISVFAVITAFFIRKPDPAPQGGWAGGH